MSGLRTKEQRKADNARWKAAHKEYIAAYNAEYYASGRWRIKPATKAKVAARSKVWAIANAAYVKKRFRAWSDANPDKRNALAEKRRAAKLQCVPRWIDHDAIAMIYRTAHIANISGFDVHVDHIVPLQSKHVSGLHWHGNLQIIPSTANYAKSNRRWPNMPSLTLEENRYQPAAGTP